MVCGPPPPSGRDPWVKHKFTNSTLNRSARTSRDIQIRTCIVLFDLPDMEKKNRFFIPKNYGIEYT